MPDLLRRCGRMAASTVLVVAVVVAAVVTGPAAGQSSAGTRITRVSVEQGDGDATVIEVSFDGPIGGHRWSHISDGNPRAVVKIAGVVEAYRPYEVAVDDGRVRRVRIGHHPEFEPPEEHLVFDLVDDRVSIARVVKKDRRLVVVLRRVEHPAAPTPTEPVPTTVPATPAPTKTPTATATPTPTPRVAPTATATPAPPTPPIAAPPTATPTGPMPPEPPHAAATDLRDTAVPPPPEAFSGPYLTELVISHREDGSALVRVTADGPIEGSDVQFFGVRVPPPRYLLVIPGAGLPGEDAVLPVRDGLLCEIGVAFTSDGGPARTELTFNLASSEVTFEQAAVKGAHAVIVLRPPADPQARLGCEVESRTRSRAWRFTASGTSQKSAIGTE